MKTVLLIAGTLVMFASVVPYILDVLHRKTKPRIVSWFNWSLLFGISGAAALADQQYPSAVLTLTDAAACALIVVLGIKRGKHTFEPLDIVCQVAALVGLLLWILLDSPLLAISITAAIDFVVTLP